MVGRRGLEPRTYGLKVRSSTIELATRETAGDGHQHLHPISVLKPISRLCCASTAALPVTRGKSSIKSSTQLSAVLVQA